MAAVLVVDDSSICRRVAIGALKSYFEVDSASDGREALQLVRRKQYAAILMDLDMPHIDGIDATKLIRVIEQFNGERAVIIAYSASDSDRTELCRAAGMDGYQKKPCPPSQLVEILEASLTQGPISISTSSRRWTCISA